MPNANRCPSALASVALVFFVVNSSLADPASRRVLDGSASKGFLRCVRGTCGAGQPSTLPEEAGTESNTQPVTQRDPRDTTRSSDEEQPPVSDKVVDGTRQHWGLAEVRPGARLFYWLYLTRAPESTPTARPLVLWLQGGPGVSASGYGNFEELGIVDVNLQPRNLTWVNDVNVLFVDSPVGTGFSSVDTPDLLPNTNKQVADDLVAFMRIFMSRYPDFAATPLYIFSEAYGGKMAAQFALDLSGAVSKGMVPANLKGLAMGDPWIAPVDAIQTWAPFLLYQGLIDDNGHDRIMAAAQEVKFAAKKGQWKTATALWNATEWLVLAETGGVDMRNILTRISTDVRRALGSITDSKIVLPTSRRRSLLEPSQGDEKDELHAARVLKPRFRQNEREMDTFMNGHVAPRLKLPSNPQWVGISNQVFSALAEDFMKPVTTVIEQLLNETSLEVSVFSSQLDLAANARSITQWVDGLKWAGSRSWRNSPRKSLPISHTVEGDRKIYGNLAVYWIRRIGQMLPAENPRVGRELLRRVTNFDLHDVYDYLSDNS